MYASVCKTTKETLIIFLIICASSLDAEQNDNCPESASAWREKESSFGCGRGKYYHCLKNEKQRTVQTCLGKSWVQPGFCPEYNSIANEIDVFLCKESLGECPVATFWSNELYKYTGCLNAVVTNEDKTIKESGGNKDSKGGLNVSIIIVIACSSLLLVSVVIVGICCVFRKKKEDSKHDVELSEIKARSEKRQVKSDCEDPTASTSCMQDESVYSDKHIKTEGEGPEAIKLLTEEKKYEKLPTTEQIRILIENNLRSQGDRLVLVLELASVIETIKIELKEKEPGYINVESFDDWPDAAKEGGCTVLLSCVLKACIEGSIIRHRRKLEKIASESEKLKLIIPVRENVFNVEESNMSNLALFKNIAYHKIK